LDGLWPYNALPLLFGQDIFPTSAYKNGKADTAYLTHPKMVKAIQFHQDLTYKYKVLPTANFKNYTGSISIPSNKSIDFITYFYALKDMQDMIMANGCMTNKSLLPFYHLFYLSQREFSLPVVNKKRVL
jgi:hypothetical protein